MMAVLHIEADETEQYSIDISDILRENDQLKQTVEWVSAGRERWRARWAKVTGLFLVTLTALIWSWVFHFLAK